MRSSELCSMGGEAHSNAGKKRREKKRAREEWMRERERRERGAE